MLILTQSAKNCIGSRTYATLQRQELLWNTALMHFFNQELGSKETNLLSNRVAILKGTSLIRNIALYYTNNLILRNAYIWLTDTVANMLDGYSLAVRGIQWLVYIVNELCIRIVERVELQNDLLGQTGSCRRNTTGSSQVNMIVVTHLFDVAHLKNSPINITIESITQLLSHVTQVKIVIWNLSHIYMLTEIGVGSIRSTILDSLCISQITISTLTCRSTCEDTYFKLAASLMLSYSNFCQLLCGCLSYTCWCKSTHSDIIAILNQCCSLGSSHTCKRHNRSNLQIRVQNYKNLL